MVRMLFRCTCSSNTKTTLSVNDWWIIPWSQILAYQMLGIGKNINKSSIYKALATIKKGVEI